jgi:hypothetical protein
MRAVRRTLGAEPSFVEPTHGAMVSIGYAEAGLDRKAAGPQATL